MGNGHGVVGISNQWMPYANVRTVLSIKCVGVCVECSQVKNTVPLRNKRTSHTKSIRAYAYAYTRIRV